MQNVDTTRSLSNAKIMGGIGAILTLLLFVPYNVGGVLVIIGWILIILAIRDISHATGNQKIFNNALISVLLTIVAVAIFAIVVAAAVLGFIGLNNQGLFQSTTPPPASSGFYSLLADVLAGLAVVWVVGLVASIFLYKSFKLVSSALNVGLFGTAATIYLIGSILTVVLIGFFLTFIAQIMFIIAFFSIPDRAPVPIPSSVQTGPTL